MIHPTAIIDPKAEIDAGVTIGPFAIVKEHSSIGRGTVIGSHAIIEPYVTMGPDCQVFQFASVGAIPQALKFQGEKTYLKIGRGTIIREFVTINRGTAFGGGVTEVGENNLLMAYCHVAHDCLTGSNVILANNATLAGHIIIDDFAIVGGLVAVHQFARIGKYAYVGGKSAVVKDIPPFVIAAGDRAKLHGLNRVGLKRHGFTDESVRALKKTYRLVFRIGLTLNEAIERVKAEVEPIPEVKEFISFIQASERGITR